MLAKPCCANESESADRGTGEVFKLQVQGLRLEGGVEDQASPLNVLQRKNQPAPAGTSQSPILVPVLKELQAELSKARLNGRVDDSDYKLVPKFVPQVPRIDTARGAIPRAQISKTNQPLSPDAQEALQAELRKVRDNNIDIRFGIAPQFPVGSFPVVPGSRAPLTQSEEASLRGELLRANSRPSTNLQLDVNGQLMRSKALVDKQMSEVSAQLRSVLRSVKPASDRIVAGVLMPRAEEIAWDAWYQQVARLSEPRLLKCLEDQGNPSGTNTLEITVTANRVLTAKVSNASNPAFDAATIKAYRLLNGRAELQFPPGSRRKQITFFVDNDHELAGTVSDVLTTPCSGDRELVR